MLHHREPTTVLLFSVAVALFASQPVFADDIKSSSEEAILATITRPAPSGRVVTTIVMSDDHLAILDDIQRTCVSPRQPRWISTRVDISSIGKVKILENGPHYGVQISSKTKFTLSGTKTLDLDTSKDRETCDGSRSSGSSGSWELIVTNDLSQATELAAAIEGVLKN